MAEITRRRTGHLLRKLFEILGSHPDGLQAAVALDRLANSIDLTNYENGNYEGGVRRFEKIVRFATIDCVKAGWLLKDRGTWIVTEAGKAAYSNYPDPENFYKEAARLYRVWKSGQPKQAQSVEIDQDAEISEQGSISITFEEAEEQAWAEIDRYLRRMNPYDFQHLVADLLRAMSYHVSWVAPPGKDGGVDVIAHTDALGTKAPRIKVQVKRINDKVNIDGVRSFLAIINEDDVGLYISLGGFTKDADDFARNQERRKVTLIDLQRLVDLWIQHYSQLGDTARGRLPLTPIYFLTP